MPLAAHRHPVPSRVPSPDPVGRVPSRRPPPGAALVAALAVALAACGGSDDSGSAPTVSCVAGGRVDVAASAAPACLRVSPGAVVTLANGRTAALEVRSAPHPTHGSCPELDATPAIPPGGTIDVTMVTAATCRFHDHATGAPLGIIQVGSGSPGDPTDPYQPRDPY